MERLSPALRPEVLCTGCDAPNSAEATFCTSCGTALGPARRPVVAPPPQAQPGPRCGRCGVTNPSIAIYCVHCGSGLRAAGPPPVAQMFATAGGPPLIQHIYMAAPVAAPLALWVRALWFLFVGLWFGQIWLVVAWLANLTLIGLPIGMRMLSAMPQVMTLRQEQRPLQQEPGGGQANFGVRAIYFVTVGWWLSLIWLQLAWLAAATVIGLPVAFAMFERVGAVMTLENA